MLNKAVARNNGALPPSVDVIAPGAWKGTDWGNLLSVVPEPLLDPWHPRVTATLRDTQRRYREGITSYEEPDDGVFLHHYLTIKNTQTELVRGEQEQAMREFYAELLHTSSTHAGFEYAIRPWGSRDFEGNMAPHGWFAADYRNLLRNMMVREEHGSLHLLSAVSPEWIGAGKSIRVTAAPTYFGTVSFTLDTTADNSALLHLQFAPDNKASSPAAALGDIVLHLPWFLVEPRVTLDGKVLAIDHGAVRFPADTLAVKLTWSRRLPITMSYERTVRSYEAAYRMHYDELMQTGEMFSGLDTWRVPE